MLDEQQHVFAFSALALLDQCELLRPHLAERLRSEIDDTPRLGHEHRLARNAKLSD